MNDEIPSKSKRQEVNKISVDKKTKYFGFNMEIIDKLIVKNNKRFSEITLKYIYFYY